MEDLKKVGHAGPKEKKGLSLMDKLAMLANISLTFVSTTPSKSSTGDKIAILQLEQPIPLVRGSQSVQLGNATIPVSASDVREIKVHQADIEAADEAGEFSFDADGTGGTYNGSTLSLDVSKSNKEVWLRATSFAQSGQNFRAQANNEKLEKLFGTPVTKAPAAKAEPKETE